MDPIKIEIENYREINKGSLKGIFSLIIHPFGQKILDCRYFVQSDKEWFNFPQKEITYSDGRKTVYLPYISYLDKVYVEQLKNAVLIALKDFNSQEGHAKNSTYQKHKNSLPSKSSSNWEEPPF